MRDFTTTEYIKRMCVTEEHYKAINNIKGKKSGAGKLKEIIEFYLTNKFN